MPNTIGASPDGRYLYVAGFDNGAPGGNLNTKTLLVVDTTNPALANQQRVDVGGFPGIATVSPTAKQVYVAVTKNFGPDPAAWQGHVVVLDTTNNNAVVKDTYIGRSAISTAFSRDGKLAYASDGFGDIHVFDTATNIEITTAAFTTPTGHPTTSSEPRRQHRHVLDRDPYTTEPGPVYKITGSTANQKPTGVTATPVSHDSGIGATTYQLSGTDPDGDDISYTATQPPDPSSERQRHVHLHARRPFRQWHRQLLR